VLVEVCKTKEGLHVFDIHQGWLFLDGGDLRGVHLAPIYRNDEAKILDFLLVKLTLLGL
jgi:hypothetical protein